MVTSLPQSKERDKKPIDLSKPCELQDFVRKHFSPVNYEALYIQITRFVFGLGCESFLFSVRYVNAIYVFTIYRWYLS